MMIPESLKNVVVQQSLKSRPFFAELIVKFLQLCFGHLANVARTISSGSSNHRIAHELQGACDVCKPVSLYFGLETGLEINSPSAARWVACWHLK